ncbi:hypothetical protein QCA50_007570 [Cerrena zonata]|uniref:DNA repair protein REV1 n=1 Tax=Cerrena zonata TaxID=2478898 RepID=A0AAW0GC22_9APHY
MAATNTQSTASSDYFEEDDPEFLEALSHAVLPGDIVTHNDDTSNLTPGFPTTQPKPNLKRPRSPDLDEPEDLHESPVHHRILSSIDDDKTKSGYLNSDTYGAATFGGFGEYMARKRAKLQVQNTELQDIGTTNKIFNGLQIYINGWTEPSVQDLRQLIIKYGGIYHPYLDKKGLVTHIITCYLTPNKIKEFQHMKVVRPEWLTESVNAGTLLPWSGFRYQANERLEQEQGKRAPQKSIFDFATQSSTAPRSSIVALDSGPPQQSSQLEDTSVLLHGGSSPQTPTKSPPNPLPLYTTDPTTLEPAKGVPSYASHKPNPHAERAMADPVWRAAHTSIAPDFIEGYYKNSRLHHLSSWKAELKSLVSEAMERAENGTDLDMPTEDGGVEAVRKVVQQNMGGKGWVDGGNEVSMKDAQLVMRSPSRKGKEKAIDDSEDRVIMHCDFDSFFVSAGLIDRPHLRGKPVVVCHSQGNQGGLASTSEIASASYEAREFGIKGGMSLQQARKLCPQVLTIPYEFELYKKFSLQFYTILMAHADDLQAVSVDEALVEVTTSVRRIKSEIARSQGNSSTQVVDPAKDFAEAIRAQVKRTTNCEVSIGIANNIMLARLASRKAKPAGSYHIHPQDAVDFLAPLDIKDLHGFGHATRQKAEEKLGATNLGELAKKSRAVLCDALGKGTGETLYKAIRGIDDRKLESDKQRKSVSCDINYGIRFENNQQAEIFVFQLAQEVSKRMKDIDVLGRSLTVKIMIRDQAAPKEAPKFLGHGVCETFTKQAQLVASGGRPTSDDKVIGEHAWRLLKSFNFDPKELRGIGIQVQKLEKASGEVDAEPGQARLPFQPVDGTKTSGLADNIGMVPKAIDRTVQRSLHFEDMVPIPEPTKPGALGAMLDLPNFSQVDRSVFDALPEDIRAELEAEYQRRSIPPEPPAPVSPIKEQERKQVMLPGRPVKRVMFKEPERPNLARITRQLAPRSRAALPGSKSTLFNKTRFVSRANVTDAELRRLNIDPAVFSVLPPDLQREQLAGARFKKTGKMGVTFPTQRKRLRPIVLRRKGPRKRPKYVPPPPPKAEYPERPALRQQGKTKAEKLSFSEKDDLQNVIEQWIRGFIDHPPNQKDVDYFAKFLVRCVDGSSDYGFENAVAVVKWWLVLIRRHFGAWEGHHYGPDIKPKKPYTTEVVGRVWWRAFGNVKAKMDAAAKKRFGGCISLR